MYLKNETQIDLESYLTAAFFSLSHVRNRFPDRSEQAVTRLVLPTFRFCCSSYSYRVTLIFNISTCHLFQEKSHS